MSDEHDFRVRPGRIRSTRAQSSRPFIAQALAAAQKAGGGVSRSGRIGTGNSSRFGRGRAASLQANRFLTGRSRLATIKTRVVRHSKRGAPLATHLNYLRREGVTRDDARARMFGPVVDDASTADFVDRCKDDRHHFRFIVSPEDASEMADLKSFTRDLMGRVQKDLGTSLDWVAVDHWNTDNPHVHVILRGRADDGQDLVISRDYISRGMRDRASELVTQELGPRSEPEIRRHVERQVEAERWTGLDRRLLRDAGENGFIDLAPRADRQPDEFIAPKIGRLRRLETLGLAEQLGPGQWIVSERAEATLRQMGERADIIKRMHRAFSARDIERASASYVTAAEIIGERISGRLIWLRAYDWTTDQGAAALNDYARAADPFSKVGKQQVAVDISSVIRASPGSFRVAWIEHHYENGQLSGTERWTAILTIVTQMPSDAERLRVNPLGIYVNAINWSREMSQ
ncbi:conjugal transfer protein TrbF [Mesorhizobium sp. B2-8-9]|uniref:conjugal transfer protein TrbF n=1 Tax=Mesorhizobium sp. B2-8-9 TaxID=2589899 RepID=UPI0015E428BB|nr:conjugal transfer protein TrbF [Mesorhizobium sp. B2-8-9]